MAAWICLFFVMYLVVLLLDCRRRRATESITQVLFRSSPLAWAATLLFCIATIVAILGPDTFAASSWKGMDLTKIVVAFASGALGAVAWLVFEAVSRRRADAGHGDPLHDPPTSPSSQSDLPTLVGMATGGMLKGYRIEIWPAEAEGWDVFYFAPDRDHPEYNSYADDWTTALMQSDTFTVVWHGGLEWDEDWTPEGQA